MSEDASGVRGTTELPGVLRSLHLCQRLKTAQGRHRLLGLNLGASTWDGNPFHRAWEETIMDPCLTTNKSSIMTMAEGPADRSMHICCAGGSSSRGPERDPPHCCNGYSGT